MAWGGGGKGFGAQVPLGRNPFAAPVPGGVPPVPSAPGARGPAGDDGPTGPMLGRHSELQRLFTATPGTGHVNGVNCMVVVDDKIYSGGRDNNLCMWRGQQAPGGGFQLALDGQPLSLGQSISALFYEPSSKWLFCGLWNGEIQAYCKDPMLEDRLTGHRRSVSSLTVHSSVLVSGSNDGTVRLWTMNPQSRRFACHGQPLQNPSGAVTAVKVLRDSLWVAAQSGITCFDLGTLQARGTIPSPHQVTGLLEFEGYMIATFRNGDVKIYDASGVETHCHPSRGEHTSNTAVEIMVHPVANKPMLLCGQQFGYVTAYDLPEFRPRGSFVCKNQSDVKAILDIKMGGMFLTGGLHGDVSMWQWGASGAQPGAVGAPAASPFAQGQPVAKAASPFAPVAPGAAGMPAGMPAGMGGFGPTDLMMG